MPFADFDLDARVIEASGVGQGAGIRVNVRALADAWRSQLLPVGSVVLICMPNGKPLLGHFQAVLQAGLVPAMVAPNTPAARLVQMAQDFHAGAIVRPHISADLTLDLGLTPKQARADGEIARMMKAPPPLTRPGEVILTTSGTSSEFSSGCVHSIDSLQRNARRHAQATGLRSDDVVLAHLPLYYSYALVAQALACMECGSTLVVGGPPFMTRRYAQDIMRHGVTISSVTPLLLRQLLDNPEDRLPSCLRALTVGGDALPTAQTRQFLADYPGRELYLTYGITEAGPRVATLAAHASAPEHWASMGLPLEDTEVRLVDVRGGVEAAQRAVDGTTEGELLVHSDTLLLRKIGRNAVYPLVEIDGKAWLRTGDVFRVGADGHLFFRHRKSDFIVLNDEKVNLAAIKQYCRSLSGVLTCQTRSLKHDGATTGFSLEIVVDQALVPHDSLDALRLQVLKGLKRHERPTTLNLVPANQSGLDRYK
ncbi:class I adenylate-forming enzyme family protein [Thiomonas sp. X19]|uniref:class I adenylate-forming enzyme family protein n=1 Tax=Thiomonas sp. X19 TaxID=1050370 RepID=UPI000DD6F7F5|nr:class I adenylate-forming enzyme family protein [Thiomonas sp. X19]